MLTIPGGNAGRVTRGSAIAELVLRGRFETIDLSALGYARNHANRPYPERGIVQPEFAS